jgi:Tol biopolymer transport system component
VTEPGAYVEPRLSPSGDRLAVTRSDPATGEVGVWIRDLERGGWSRLSTDGSGATPVWSPDGLKVAYSTFPEGGVLAREISGGRDAEELARTPTFWPLEDWSPDGRHIVLSTTQPEQLPQDLWVVDLEVGGNPTELVASPAWEHLARFSPDGRYLAYVSDEGGQPDVYVQPFPSLGSRLRVSVDGGTQPTWGAGGRELFYADVDGSLMVVELTEADGGLVAGAPQRLFGTHMPPLVETRNHYDVSRDGQRFVVNSRFLDPESQRIAVWIDP